MSERTKTAVLRAIAVTVVAGSVLAGAPAALAGTGVSLDHGALAIPVSGGVALLDPATLRVDARTAAGKLVLSEGAQEPLGAPGPLSIHNGTYTWSYPSRGLTASASARDGRLVVDLRASADGDLNWPVTGTDRAASAVQFPRGEGLSVPVADPWWNGQLGGTDPVRLQDLTMPFWGYTLGSVGAGYVVPTDLGTSLRFVSSAGRLHTSTAHHFAAADGTDGYTVAFSVTDGSPVAPALDYRRWLANHGQLGNLEQKIRANPAVGKLIGAFHAYLWGDGRTTEAVRQMRQLGLGRMWLGYDSDDSPMPADAVRAAEDAGYLVGPYDSWDNAQDPATADTPAARWPSPVWPQACVEDAQGKPETGFQGRGCYVSSQALADAEPTHHYLADRVAATAASGADSYFLDVDATGELFRDHSAAHPMTEAQDRANRLSRMAKLSGEFVLGSESAGAWANQVLAFSHGSSTPVADGLWAAERDKDAWGTYWPPARPGFFFKPATISADLAKAMFDPRYRVPLYETVLHDSVISLDRWELPLDKLPGQRATRIQLAMLYNTPLNLALDRKALTEEGPELASLQRFFAGLQSAAGTKAMTGFRTLSGDGRVQQTTFGDHALVVTANFGSTAYQGLPGGCVSAERPGRPAERLCPKAV
ncbi:glycoside hydrolase [Amycolatopsis sp. NBC_00345]|uniref:glycoside hydrolase n=1 Tax=Amycolatopsis sp. NBC_00345 TaxID=2975955 RepID=UPI002E257632